MSKPREFNRTNEAGLCPVCKAPYFACVHDGRPRSPSDGVTDIGFAIESSADNAVIWQFTRALKHLAQPQLVEYTWTAGQVRDISLFGGTPQSVAWDFAHGNIDHLFATVGDAIVLARSWGDQRLNVVVASPSQELSFEVMRDITTRIPRMVTIEEDKVQMQFWSATSHGCSASPRAIPVPTWDSIRHNYHATTRAELEDAMAWSSPALSGGRLMLWHGQPGVGKTFAIRAMARMWRKWCSFHFVTDPEAMLGSGHYCMQVLRQVEPDDNDGLRTTHHVLVMEDTGELLVADAKERTGQGLSRLLNIVDGILGQGSNVMVLITTNENLGAMYPAVTRPGRCLMNLHFDKLTPDEGREWAHHEKVDPSIVSGHMTVAELYAAATGRKIASARQPLGFTPR